MKRTRIRLGLDPDDYIEVEGSDGKARLIVSEILTRQVVQVLNHLEIMQVVNALLVCLMTEDGQREMEACSHT
jgi:hypothetical protein